MRRQEGRRPAGWPRASACLAVAAAACCRRLPPPPLKPRPALLFRQPPAELENHLGLADKTLAEFIIELAKGKPNVKEFRLVLRENGADMPDSLVDTLWAVIQRMLPGGRPGGGGGGGEKLQPRPGAGPYGGLAMPDTRDRVKQVRLQGWRRGWGAGRQAAAARRSPVAALCGRLQLQLQLRRSRGGQWGPAHLWHVLA